MKIKVDENLPGDIAALLVEHGHEAETVFQEGLQGRSDAEVWTAAQGERRFLVTLDLDFSDARKYAPGTHAGILLLRLPEEGCDAVCGLMKSLLTHYDFESWSGAFVVATPTKVRIRVS